MNPLTAGIFVVVGVMLIIGHIVEIRKIWKDRR